MVVCNDLKAPCAKLLVPNIMFHSHIATCAGPKRGSSGLLVLLSRKGASPDGGGSYPRLLKHLSCCLAVVLSSVPGTSMVPFLLLMRPAQHNTVLLNPLMGGSMLADFLQLVQDPHVMFAGLESRSQLTSLPWRCSQSTATWGIVQSKFLMKVVDCLLACTLSLMLGIGEAAGLRAPS